MSFEHETDPELEPRGDSPRAPHAQWGDFDSDESDSSLETGDLEAEVVDRAGEEVGYRPRRRIRTPLILFLATCASTFLVGASQWLPTTLVAQAMGGDLMPMRRAFIAHWDDGLLYMLLVLAILMTHEMGHFVATLIYRVPASLPYFLPLPITPIGTMGAVIGMDGMRANRKEIFDIGIAGPIAGLVIAIPVLWYGIGQLDLTQRAGGPFLLDNPLVMNIMLQSQQPPGYKPGAEVWVWQLNPYVMAGWVGMLITGLNMLPISQLDGGHVAYTLFGPRAHWLARGVLFGAIAAIVWFNLWPWMLMVGLIMLMGTDHPPTRDDSVPLGPFRVILGLASLAIPVLCLPSKGLAIIIPGAH